MKSQKKILEHCIENLNEVNLTIIYLSISRFLNSPKIDIEIRHNILENIGNIIQYQNILIKDITDLLKTMLEDTKNSDNHEIIKFINPIKIDKTNGTIE